MLKLFICLSLFYTRSATLSTTPVILIDFDRVTSSFVQRSGNPLQKMPEENFEKIIKNILQKSRVVLIFVEDTFCMEDLTTKERAETPFSFIKESNDHGRIKFLPRVVSPYKTLKNILPELKKNTYLLSVTSSHKFRIHDEKIKHIYIHFIKDNSKIRTNLLRTHDSIMKAVYILVRRAAKGPVTAFYTGKTNPIIIKKAIKEVEYQEPDNTKLIVASEMALFRLMGVYSSVGIRRSTFDQPPEVTHEAWYNEKFWTRISYLDFEVEFEFTTRRDGWSINDVVLLEGGEEVGRTKVDGGAPWQKSYLCGEPIVLVNTRDASTVTISRYQIQPFSWEYRRGTFDTASLIRSGNGSSANEGNSSQGNTTFGTPVLCAPYFPASVLSCLFVTFICFSILVYGLVSLFNLQGNDRYDDPQGKPLVINSEGGH